MQRQIKIYNVSRLNHSQSFILRPDAFQYALFIIIRDMNLHLDWIETFIESSHNNINFTKGLGINNMNSFVNLYNDNKLEEAYEIIHDMFSVSMIEGKINENLILNKVDIKIPKINLETLNKINKYLIFK